MPLFEYRCSKCDHLEEVLQKHGDPPPAVCPKCGKKKTLHKEMSRTSFQLKGGGWYKDLYASSSSTPSSSSSSDGDGGDGGGKKTEAPATTTEAKPAAKPDAPAAKPAAKPEKKTEKKAKAAA